MGKVGAGRPTILTTAEEKEIVVTCQVLQELGYGLTREIVTDVVSTFLRDHLLTRMVFLVQIGGKAS